MISTELLCEIFRLWQQHGYDGQSNKEICHICPCVGPTRRVGKEKKYWICSHCARKFILWNRHEIAAAAAAHTEAAAILMQLSQQTPSDE